MSVALEEESISKQACGEIYFASGIPLIVSVVEGFGGRCLGHCMLQVESNSSVVASSPGPKWYCIEGSF